MSGARRGHASCLFRVSMNSTSLPASWARPAHGDAGSRLHAAGVQGLEWHLQRRCSLSPAQLGASFAIVVLVSLAVALGFWWLGAPIVSAFAGLEVVLVAVGFGWHALQAADGERLHLQGTRLTIDVRRGLRVQCLQLDASWLRANASRAGGIDLTLGRRTVRVGTLVDAATNRRVLNELSQALAATRRAEPASE